MLDCSLIWAKLKNKASGWHKLDVNKLLLILFGVVVLEVLLSMAGVLSAWQVLLYRCVQILWVVALLYHFDMIKNVGLIVPDRYVIRAFYYISAVAITLVFLLQYFKVLELEHKYFISFNVLDVLLFILIAPMLEELFFRALLYRLMRQMMPLTWAMVLNTLLFTLMHGDVSIAHLIGGWLFVISYEYSRNLYLPMMLHIGANTGILYLAVI